jgi:2-phospho-L-lactate transferase/gluconeogenesis factor (CofD/UPF0052 family)
LIAESDLEADLVIIGENNLTSSVGPIFQHESGLICC